MYKQYQLCLNTRFRFKRVAPWASHVQLSFSRRRVNISFFVEVTSPILRFTDFFLVAHSAKFKMNHLSVKYRSWSCPDSQKLQNKCNASSYYPTTIFALCIYFLHYETPLFRIHVFRTRRLIHTPSLSWLQNLNFKLGALRREKRRNSAFYTGTSCLKTF